MLQGDGVVESVRPSISNRHRKTKEYTWGTYVRHSAGALAVSASVWIGPLYAPLIGDVVWHTETGQERAISDSLARAKIGDISVRCLARDDLTRRLSRVKDVTDQSLREHVRGFAAPYVPEVWLRQDVCSRITDYINSYPRPGSPEQFSAVRAAIHETEHVSGVTSEPEAECRSVQHAISVATAMRRATNTVDATKLLKDNYVWQQQNPKKVWPDYNLHNCYRGGPYDLHLYEQGVPVVFPPDALSHPNAGW